MGAGVLSELLEGIRTHSDPNLLVGFDKSDDASVYKLNDELALVQTVDFFPPIADDPYLFGQIAAVNALSISGFDLSSFLFYGFFPRENAERRKLLNKMRRADTRTFAFYESPKRIMELVDFFIEEDAAVELCLCNDMTKLHEMSFRGSPAQVKEQLEAKGNYDKGEYVAVVELKSEYMFTRVEHVVSPEALLVEAMVKGNISPREAIAAVMADDVNTYSKNELKAAALSLKRLFGE